MQARAIFKYKCRKCGEEYGRGLTSERNAKDLLGSGLRNDTGIPPMAEYKSCHVCADGNIGVSDLIGYDIER
jgi:hypothetical protein